jgi:hypothetical protein
VRGNGKKIAVGNKLCNIVVIIVQSTLQIGLESFDVHDVVDGTRWVPGRSDAIVMVVTVI